MLGRPAPPSKHQLALMLWLAVFPTLNTLAEVPDAVRRLEAGKVRGHVVITP
jgi:hypothetical protein